MTEVVNVILWVLLGATVCYAFYKIGVRDGDIDSTNKMRNLELLSKSFILSEQRRLEDLQDGIDGRYLCEFVTITIYILNLLEQKKS